MITTLEGMNELLDQIDDVKEEIESGSGERPLFRDKIPEIQPGTPAGSGDHRRTVPDHENEDTLFWCSSKEHIVRHRL